MGIVCWKLGRGNGAGRKTLSLKMAGKLRKLMFLRKLMLFEFQATCIFD